MAVSEASILAHGHGLPSQVPDSMLLPTEKHVKTTLAIFTGVAR